LSGTTHFLSILEARTGKTLLDANPYRYTLLEHSNIFQNTKPVTSTVKEEDVFTDIMGGFLLIRDFV
jgi:hypothetical protein